MRFIHLYLVGYFILVIGIGLAVVADGRPQPRLADLDRHRRDHRGRPGDHAVGIVRKTAGQQGDPEMTSTSCPAGDGRGPDVAQVFRPARGAVGRTEVLRYTLNFATAR